MNERSLTGILDTVWSHLTRGKADRKHPARHPTLATIGPDGPELRTLVLRAVDRDVATLECHTDATSPKVDHITNDPRVALHVWVPSARLQIRLRATATLHPGDATLFAQLPPEAQANYAGPAPGSAPQAPTPNLSPEDRFTRILCHVTEIDALLLNTPHRRACFTKDTAWSGTWIAP